jgi:hypothetical protein
LTNWDNYILDAHAAQVEEWSMLAHLLNLLVRSFLFIPSALGSTWLGIAFPVVAAALSEVFGILRFGWTAVRQNLKKAIWVGFAGLGVAYTLLFLWCAIKLTYSDHMSLVKRTQSLQNRLDVDAQHERDAVQDVRTDLGSRVSALQQDCAAKGGGIGILQQQVAAQQAQITACLLQQKEVPTTRVFPGTREAGNGPRMEYLLTTNVVRSPVDLTATCTFPIERAALRPMTVDGTANFSWKPTRVTANAYELSLGNPAWSPSGPLWITIFFVPPVESMPSCSFDAK